MMNEKLSLSERSIKSQSQLIVVPYLHLLRSILKVEGGYFRTATTKEFEEKYGELNFTMRVHTLKDYLGSWKRVKEYPDIEWTVLELTNLEIPSQCYKAFLDLISAHWEYELSWQGLDATKRRPKLKRVHISEKFIQEFNAGSKLIQQNRRFRVALMRWFQSYNRIDSLDAVLDCCSCLEASFQMGDELRLRTALAVYHTIKKNRRESFRLVYEMYGVRNDFIHGSNIPNISPSTRKKYITLVANVLNSFIKEGRMPNSKTINNKILRQFGGKDM